MKKEYISPEIIEFAFDTVGSMMVSITSNNAVDPANSRAPGLDDEDDDEEWGDEEDAVGGRRKVY